MRVAYLNREFVAKPWMKHLGALSFAFFFIKGLLWLAAPLVFYYML